MVDEMMRDGRASREYFNEVISLNKDSLQTSRSDVDDPEIRSDPDYYVSLMHMYQTSAFSVADCSYSIGELPESFARYASELVTAETIYQRAQAASSEGRLTFDMHQAQYSEPLRILSIAVLIDTPQSSVDDLVEATGSSGLDAIYDFLASPDHDPSAIGESVVWPKPYKRLLDVIASPSEHRPKLMQAFLKYWYSQNRRAPWWGTHLTAGEQDFRYSGYWCYEAAAVTKVLGIDDSSYRDNEYYPRDLLPRTGG